MFGSDRAERCVNYDTCGNTATSTIEGWPVCGSCNVYQGNVDTDRGTRCVTVISRR